MIRITPFLLFGVVLLVLLISLDASRRGRPRVAQVAKIEDEIGDTKSIKGEDGDLGKKALGAMVACQAEALAMIEDIRNGSGEDDADIKDRACQSMSVFHLDEERHRDNVENICTALTSIALMTFAHSQESDLASCEDAVEVGLRSVREIRNETDASRAVLSKLVEFPAKMHFYRDFLKKLIGGRIFRRSEL